VQLADPLWIFSLADEDGILEALERNRILRDFFPGFHR
jgi:hypothetical protein